MGTRWRDRLAQDAQNPEQRRTAMRAVNPAFIPRNHRVEAVIEAAVQHDDFAPFEELLTVLARPSTTSRATRLYGAATAGRARDGDIPRT